MNRIRVMVPVILCLAPACVRLLTPGASASGADLGTQCGQDGECKSGVCSEDVCCEKRCGEGVACNLRTPGRCELLQTGDACQKHCAGGDCVGGRCCSGACNAADPRATCGLPLHEGECLRRELGDLCTADNQCPGNTCEDGVCCEARCGACQRCDVAGHSPGSCAFVAPNTDPDLDCSPADAGATCSACFSGLCLPATPGTDPVRACRGALTCSTTSSCALAAGASCAEDAQCARGACLGGVCSSVEEVVVPLPSAVGTAAYRQRYVQELTATPAGDVAVVMVDRVYWYDHAQTEGRTFMRYGAAANRWTTLQLPFYEPVAALTSVGEYVYLLAASHHLDGCDPLARNQLGVSYCSLSGMFLDVDGRPTAIQENLQSLIPGVTKVCGLTLATLPDNSLLAAVQTPMGGVGCLAAAPWLTHLLHRHHPSGAWSHLGDGPSVVDTHTVVALGMVGGEYSVLQRTSDAGGVANGTALIRLDAQGRETARAALPVGPCENVVSANGWFSRAGDVVLLGGRNAHDTDACLASFQTASGWTVYPLTLAGAVTPLRASGGVVQGLLSRPGAVLFTDVLQDGSSAARSRSILEQTLVGFGYQGPVVAPYGAVVFATATTQEVEYMDTQGVQWAGTNVDMPELVFLH